MWLGVLGSGPLKTASLASCRGIPAELLESGSVWKSWSIGLTRRCGLALMGTAPPHVKTPGQLGVFGHDGQPLGVNDVQKGVLGTDQPSRSRWPPAGPSQPSSGGAGQSGSPGRFLSPGAGWQLADQLLKCLLLHGERP